MNQIIRPELLPQRPQDDEPFYGWRYIKRVQPDGTEKYEEVLLRKEDLLYPEPGDFVVDDPQHTRDLKYCHDALETFYKRDPRVVVLGDNPVDFGAAGVRPLGPDVLVLFDVRRWRRNTTFRLNEEGGRPVLVLEIASPTTRDNDLGAKIALYYRVGVEKYVIVDRGPRGQDPATLIGRERAPRGWRMMTANAHGRLSLDPVPLLIGVEGQDTWLYDPGTGERLRDHAEAEAKAREEEGARKKAEAKTREQESARKKAEARAKRAENKARKEAEARAELEKRLQELEKQLRRRKGKS